MSRYRKNPLADHALLLSGYDYLDAVTAFREGWITVQDVSSSFVGEAADPKPGDVVLDVRRARAERACTSRISLLEPDRLWSGFNGK